VRWDANGDGNGIIRKEGDKLVLAEMEGPGCIWRIWSATPKEGHVRIYLDGASEPAVDLPFTGYFDRKNEPFTRPALVHMVARGWNNYTPIPFQKSCKVLADPGWGDYYHFTYTTFPKDTKVPTFTRQLGSAETAALDQADTVLTRCDSGPLSSPVGAKAISKRVDAAPGNTVVVAKLKGSRAITSLRVKLDLASSPADIEVLRELALQIKWDGEAEPSVWCPLGDFFGTAPGANAYRSYPMGLTKDGWWYSHWYMPFARSAEIQLVNDGKTKRQVTFEILDAPLRGDASKYSRFHAKWHRDTLLPKAPERAIDWPFLKAEGNGRFVGVMLHIWNPRGGWWGEGDEKFFVDGEKFPSTFGTGSEDYFGYAWSDPGLFQHAFHNQTRNDGWSRGHVSVNRFHIADQVPFHTQFEGCIEKYYPNSKPTLYASTVYFYLTPKGKDPYLPAPLNERVGYWAAVESYKVKNALEGERLKVLSKSGGEPQEQDLTGFQGQWSNDAHLWWINAHPGDKLELAVPVKTAGKYYLTMQFTKAPDYGIAQLYLDGEKLGEPVDFFNPSVIPSGPVGFGQKDLSAGDHKLTVEIIGANEKAAKSFMFGLDYIKLGAAVN